MDEEFSPEVSLAVGLEDWLPLARVDAAAESVLVGSGCETVPAEVSEGSRCIAALLSEAFPPLVPCEY